MMHLWILFISFIVGWSTDIVLLPSGGSGETYGFIMLQGANINNTAYEPLMTDLQSVFPNPLYVGLPEALFDSVNPADVTSAINTIYQDMLNKGLPASAPVFIGGHSLGGATLQAWTYANQYDYFEKTGIKTIVGQVLMGAFIQRQFRNQTTQLVSNYSIPTLTIGGSLDGLCRVSRIIEQVYVQLGNGRDTQSNIKNYPVVIVQGMSHMQFASGTPPYWVERNDLEPEISYSDAHSEVASIISAFMSIQAGEDSNNNNYNFLQQQISSTIEFSTPFINAFKLEGFYHFENPCDCTGQICQSGKYCAGGNQWSRRISQNVMGTLPENSSVTINDTDSFHPVQQVNPVHLPHIYSKCQDLYGAPCVLNTTTVSENTYSYLDKEDTGFESTAAIEIKTKLSSRQKVWIYAGVPESQANFTELDGGNNCAQINQYALDWGLQNADSKTLTRYYNVGERMVMGKDIGPLNAGPLWIWTRMQYVQVVDCNTNSPYLEVRSPMLRTPVDYPVRKAAGYHYCKVLSPAKVMEWIYIDSLRYNMSLNATESWVAAKEGKTIFE